MKRGILFGLVLGALAAFLVGYYARGRSGAVGSGGALATASGERASAAHPALPEVKIRRTAADPESLRSIGGKLSLAEIEARMSAMKGFEGRAAREWMKILETLGPGDYAELLGFADKSLSKSMRDRLRPGLITSWAMSDPAAAIAYANGLANKHDREQAIFAAVRGWAESDAK